MIKILNISHFASSGPRPNQEDFIKFSNTSDKRVFVVCDGMGGHGHGEVASRVVAESVFNYLCELNPDTYTEDDLQTALDFAIGELGKADVFSDEKSMGTTLVVIAINRMDILVGHVGDSRCYLFSADGERKFRTKDHSKVQEAVDAEILTEEEAWSSPKKNILTRCIQSKSKDVKIEIDNLRIEDGDTLLLCTDGVTDALQDEQLQSFVIGRDAEDFASCIKLECELSSRDNFSAIVLNLTQDEKNPSRSTNAEDSTLIDEVKPELDVICFCQNCGSAINQTASFCPSCGIPVHDTHSTMRMRPTNHSLNLLSAISKNVKENPIVYMVGALLFGVALGITIGCCIASTQTPTPAEPDNHGSMLLTKFTGFVNGVCSVDTINPQDSVILKTDIMSKYQEFLDTIKNSGVE